MSPNNTAQDSEAKHDMIREVVGVFHSASALDTAVEQLGLAGVDRAAISSFRPIPEPKVRPRRSRCGSRSAASPAPWQSPPPAVH
jgi:hypothetical protein